MIVPLVRVGFILSWLTVFFIPKKTVKRYLPTSTMSALLVLTLVFIGTPFNFWKVKGGPETRIKNILSVILGPFAVGTLWTFHLTFLKFWLFMLTNLVQNLIYAFPILTFFEKINFIKYVKFTRIHHLIASMSFALILYGFQSYLEKPVPTVLRLSDKRALK
ncbi:hypothetical protein B5V88_16930 [Heyndrickxia sporothermodurans]|uniref:hypothetical protein n=1 Tax=Heyndrickxia sporothermodurans TaxID=46224 RepID=UPI000D3AD903|nr:hypothetical protein [Heyndrickxia sporothermodurans]MBL5768296.1 hypothetical protein [Heyndrickxia sporothermodurans]MBL5772830.1 hypothetical protein [Heyndrickxia sporothermodurans]MBL5779846.1 hypothetical protein [Heyndrickxia sporothermodurans]MBL5783381.1 hypothetical protein [Heyndrickxia sporothermodurans]MBL5786719.1 hypothetical protein [Heyndrickxia sporothermodurans]